MRSRNNKILIYGYGNPGRQDDGLGISLAEEIEKWSSKQGYTTIHTDSNYQLNLEDAASISEYDIVVFADASREDIGDFLFEELKPSASVEFSMHAVSPAFILHLCGQVFEGIPEAYLMHIKGYEWEFMGSMTDQARMNLDRAITYLQKFISEKIKK